MYTSVLPLDRPCILQFCHSIGREVDWTTRGTRFHLRIILRPCSVISWKPTSEKLSGSDAARRNARRHCKSSATAVWLGCLNSPCFKTVWRGFEGEEAAWLGVQYPRTLPAFCSLALVLSLCLRVLSSLQFYIQGLRVSNTRVAEASLLSLSLQCQ